MAIRRLKRGVDLFDTVKGVERLLVPAGAGQVVAEMAQGIEVVGLAGLVRIVGGLRSFGFMISAMADDPFL